jgi:hypothetical protein
MTLTRKVGNRGERVLKQPSPFLVFSPILECGRKEKKKIYILSNQRSLKPTSLGME